MPPRLKDFPQNPSIELQQQLLLHPQTNPTNYEAFEDARTYPFEPEATSWSRVNAWWLAEASWLAYWPDENRVKDIYRNRANMSRCDLITAAGTECYVAQGDGF